MTFACVQRLICSNMCIHTEKHEYTSHTAKTKPNNTNSEIHRRVNKSRNIQLMRQAFIQPWRTLWRTAAIPDLVCGFFFWLSSPFPGAGDYRLRQHLPPIRISAVTFIFLSFLNLFFIICVWLPHKHTKNRKKTCRSQFLPSTM